MPIVSSEIVEDSPQADGRRWVRERHIDHLGVPHEFLYLADADANVEVVMNARVPSVEDQLKFTEIDKNVQEASTKAEPAISLNYSTQADLNVALREKYRTASQVDAVIIGAYLSQRTDAELSAVFDVTGTDLDNLKTRLAAKFQMMQAGATEVGE